MKCMYAVWKDQTTEIPVDGGISKNAHFVD